MRHLTLLLVLAAGCDGNGASPGANACGSESIEVDYSLPDGSRHQRCVALARGIASQLLSCTMFYSVQVSFSTNEPDITFSAEGNPFAAQGISAVAFGYASRQGACGIPQTRCDYRAYGFTCRLRVTRTGGLGDRVSGEIIEPCRLVRSSDDPSLAVTLHRARIQGTLTFGYDLDADTLVDGGPIDGINGECRPRPGVPARDR